MKYEKLCKTCNEPMSKIVYGYPTEDLSRIAKQNNWILGGCLSNPIEFYCKACKTSWSKDLGYDAGK